MLLIYGYSASAAETKGRPVEAQILDFNLFFVPSKRLGVNSDDPDDSLAHGSRFWLPKPSLTAHAATLLAALFEVYPYFCSPLAARGGLLIGTRQSGSSMAPSRGPTAWLAIGLDGTRERRAGAGHQSSFDSSDLWRIETHRHLISCSRDRREVVNTSYGLASKATCKYAA